MEAMVRHPHNTDAPGAIVNYSDGYGDLASHGFTNSLSISECEWKPFDLVQKPPGPRSLGRSGYDEEKCRNVLVRFCAHVPRNFQYKDGIQQIFLILRDHLGDENLDLAGGVLYELIEVDCEHTDDPGAAFQRWRHDHMYRYADLELPHIPHMTTITSSIVPTERLSRWRSEHANRYRFVLSDSSPLAKRDHTDSSCIRNKKAWLIDHTLFVSNRSEGTRPMRSPNPKEFHEMQWDPDYGVSGKLVDEREFSITSMDQPSETSPPGTAETFIGPHNHSRRLRHSLSSIGIIKNFVGRLGVRKKTVEIDHRRRSWMPGSFDSSSLAKNKRARCGIVSIPWPEGCQIPNAIFARKFLIVNNGESLPPHLPISQMPTAEFKATETIVEAATTGLLNQASSWLFRGPFTPQLGFDGGLDYQWNPYDSGVTVRRFDLEMPLLGHSKFGPGHSSRGTNILAYNSNTGGSQMKSKRRGQVFDHHSTENARTCALVHDSLSEASLSGTRETIPQQNCASHRSKKRPRPIKGATNVPTTLASESQPHRDSRLFNNIEFTIHTEPHNTSTPVANRQITIVEMPVQSETVYGVTAYRPEYLERACSAMEDQPTSLEDSQAISNSRRHLKEPQESPRGLLLSNLHQDTHGLQVNVLNSRQVSRRLTGEILKPLRYNASGGWKRGERR